MALSTKDQVRKYVETFTGDHIDTAALSRDLGVSRQRVWSILESLGEVRHQRVQKEKKYCKTCQIAISQNAQYCRVHSKGNIPRVSGQFYSCRTCGQSKVLEQFAKNSQYSSGYDTRCLTCRAEWQRNYHSTSHGKRSHTQTTKALTAKHPERQRAYYQVYQALRKGTLVKLPCEQCQSMDSQAVHTDYNQPLNIIWLCSLCKHRNPIAVKPYQPDNFEEQLRTFLNQTTDNTRWSSKWLKILREHYQIANITQQTLIDSLNNKEKIRGLGNSYNDLITKFLHNSTIESLL